MTLETQPGAGVTGRHLEAPSEAPPRKRRKYLPSDTRSAWILLAPALILFFVFIIVPTIAGLVLSFFKWDFFGTPTFAGLSNFSTLMGDSLAWKSLGVTMLFVLLGVVPTILLGFVLAVIVNVNMPGVGVLRVLYFVPVVLSVAVSAVLWTFIYDPRQGPVSALFRMFGAQAPDVLHSSTLAVPGLVLMMIWLALPVVILLYLSALQRVPPDIYDAAALDGAGAWRVLWSMTWPNVAGTTFVVAVLQIINFVSSSLDVSLIMTNGGPLGATRGLSLYAYQQAFTDQNVGYASVLSVLQLLVVVAIVTAGRLLIRRINR
jgi:ABC-type sugar transport system permease subunit